MHPIQDGTLVKDWFSIFRHTHKFTFQEMPSFFMNCPDIRRRIEGGENWKAIIDHQMAQLRVAGTSEWRNLISNAAASEEVGEFCRGDEMKLVMSKALYVMGALSHARVWIPFKSWKACCLEAIKQLKGVRGLKHVTSDQTVTAYYLDYLQNNGKFSLTECQEKKVLSALLCNVAYFERDANEKKDATTDGSA
jgi:hypothetical protein